MSIKSVFTALFLSMTSLCLNAQISGSQPESKPHIDVTGTAEMEVVPDQIYVSICIKERYEGRDKITVESQEEKLKAALKELNIPLENFTLSDANADYVKVKLGKKDVIAKKDYNLKLSDATQLGKVFEQLEKLQITEAYISKVDHSKMDEFRKETRKKAVKAAQEKAEYMLLALFPAQQPGKPLIVEEVPYADYNNYNLRNSYTSNFSYSESSYDKGSDEIGFKKLTIKATVFIRFEIKQ